MIRKNIQDDTSQILNIYYQASIVSHYFISAGLIKSDMETIRNELLPESQTWVYEDSGLVKGSISLFGNRVGGLFVLPDFQGKGIGTELINYVKSKHKRLILEVFKLNPKSLAFYKKCGFNIVNDNIDDHTGFEQYVMEWKST